MVRKQLTLCLTAVLVIIPAAGLGRTTAAVFADQAPPTDVGGKLSTNTEWTVASSRYQMVANVLVPSGVTLTSDPGVVVYATAGVTLQVKGAVVANGTSSGPIVFKYSRTANIPGSEQCYGGATNTYFWCGIQFVAGADGACTVTYTNISDAVIGLLDYPAGSVSNGAFKGDGTGISYDRGGPSAPALTMQNDTFDTLETV